MMYQRFIKRYWALLFCFLGINTNMPYLAAIASDSRHAYHISKTDMVFKPSEKTVQITMHIFIDDLELALEKQGQAKLFIGSEREKKEADGLIYNYLKKNLALHINGNKADYTWVGKENTSDKQALWVYLEITKVKQVKNIKVENRLLTELYADQKNIVQVNVPTKKMGYFTLDRSKPVDSTTF
jgi:hypothetical protein